MFRSPPAFVFPRVYTQPNSEYSDFAVVHLPLIYCLWGYSRMLTLCYLSHLARRPAYPCLPASHPLLSQSLSSPTYVPPRRSAAPSFFSTPPTALIPLLLAAFPVALRFLRWVVHSMSDPAPSLLIPSRRPCYNADGPPCSTPSLLLLQLRRASSRCHRCRVAAAPFPRVSYPRHPCHNTDGALT